MRLSYDEFKEELLREVEEQLPDNMRAEIRTVDKINGPVDAIQISRIGDSYSVSIGVEKIYEELYLRDVSLEKAADTIINHAISAERPPQIPELTREYIEAHMIPVAVNTETNARLLSQCPHREIEGTDLSLTVKVGIEGGVISLTKDMTRSLYMTDSEIMDIANMKVCESDYYCKSIKEVMFGLNPDLAEDMAPVMSPPLYVLTTEDGFMGASMIANKDALDRAMEIAAGGEPVYLIPSSVHELLVIPQSHISWEDIEYMVRDINQTEVSPQEVLSNKVYAYDGKHLQLADHPVEEKGNERGITR